MGSSFAAPAESPRPSLESPPEVVQYFGRSGARSGETHKVAEAAEPSLADMFDVAKLAASGLLSSRALLMQEEKDSGDLAQFCDIKCPFCRGVAVVESVAGPVAQEVLVWT